MRSACSIKDDATIRDCVLEFWGKLAAGKEKRAVDAILEFLKRSKRSSLTGSGDSPSLTVMSS